MTVLSRALLLAVALLACADPPPPPAPPGGQPALDPPSAPTTPPLPAERDTTPLGRDDARYVLEVHCGACHREDQPGRADEAIEVFNLNAIEWAATLTAEQKAQFAGRLEDQAATADDVAVVVDYLVALGADCG